MTIQICLYVIAACALLFTIVFIAVGRNAHRTMKEVDSALTEITSNFTALTEEALLTLSQTNRLLADLNFKSETLNVFFRPLSTQQTGSAFLSDKMENLMTHTAELVNLLLQGVILFKQLRRK